MFCFIFDTHGKNPHKSIIRELTKSVSPQKTYLKHQNMLNFCTAQINV